MRPPLLSAGSPASDIFNQNDQEEPVAAEPEVRPVHAEPLGWDPLLVCLAGYILVVVGRIHQLFSGLEALHPATLTGLFAIALYAMDRRDDRRLRLVICPVTKILFALLVWMVLSTPGALVPGSSFDVVFGNFIKTVLMYVVVVGSLRGIRDVERLAAVYLIAATTYSVIVISRFDLGEGDAWRLGHLYYYDANDFATFAVTAMPFGLYLLHAGRRGLTRLMAVVSLMVLTLAFVRTGSRGGFIALIAVAAFIVWRYTGVPLRWRVAVTVLVGLVVLGAASDQYWTQMGTILSDADYNRTDESGRMQIWRRGLGYMLSNPILGVGPGNFQAAEGMLSPFATRQQFGIGVRWNAAHNSYIQVGAELGIPGLCMFVGVIGGAFAALRRVRRSEIDNEQEGEDGQDEADRHGAFRQALMASLIGFVVGAYFLSLAYTEMLYVLVALAVGLEKVTALSRGASLT